MKIQTSLLALTMLLVASLAGAAPSSTQADAATANLAAIFSAPESPDCAKDAKLPSFEPAPTDQAGLPCGSCSDTLCQGKQSGAFCKFQNGKTYTCRHAYITCVASDCQCWNGPLP